MSKHKKKHPPVRPKSPARPHPGPPPPSTLTRSIVGLLVAAMIVGLWLTYKNAGPALPQIDTAALEPSTAQLIQSHLSQVDTNRGSGFAWGQLGGLLHSFSYKDEAAVCLTEAARLEPEEPRWPYLLGNLLVNSSPNQALTHFRQAVALCGNTPEAPRLRLAQTLVESGQTDEARRELETLLQAKPGFCPALLALGAILQSTDNWTNAVDLVQPCTTNPYTAKATWSLLASFHQRSGKTNSAQLALRLADTAAPDARWPDPFADEIRALRTDARSLRDRAEELLLARNPDAAAIPIGQLTRQHRDHNETWLLLGRLQQLQHQPVAAEKTLRHFLTLEPNSVNGQFQLGMSLLHQAKYEEAVQTFRHTTTLKSEFGPAYFNLGFALAKSGKKAEAIEPFKAAILHNPERVESYVLLGDLYLQLNQKSNAVELASQAQLLAPNDPRVAALLRKVNRP